jgi:DNA polymerase-3 subunit delta
MPVLVLAGDEDFELSRRLEELKNKLLDPAWVTVNFQRLENPPLPEVLDAALTVPFGPGNRLVLIDRCELFTKKRGGRGGTADGAAPAKAGKSKTKESKSKDKDSVEPEEIEHTLSKVGQNTYLIFACPYNFDTTLKISKSVSKVAKIEAFPKEKYWPGSQNTKLQNWCQKEAHRYKATIEDKAVQYLLDSTEANLRQISSELQKAAVAALPGTHITYDLIVELSPSHSNIFALAERWLTGDAKGAYEDLGEILTSQSAIPVIAALQTLLAKWIRMKVFADNFNNELPSSPGIKRREMAVPELARMVAGELKLVPFVVERDLRKLVRIPTARLVDCRQQLTHLEDLLKTGQIPERHALEIFTLHHPHS